MNKIRILPDNLANQIAAGEVVERSASVIKELVENAIDAGGRRIAVEIELGGRRLMRVSDDGEGMARDDAILAFERHATSKIKEFDDLGRIITLGFRGEALASIASVAKVELITKTRDDLAATRVIIEGGRLIDVNDAARDCGTTISVRDLFFNTPARRKFMRSEATENYHIANIVTHYSLAHPEIAFSLTNNGREVMNASPAKNLRERAFQLFGGGMLESLIPVNGGREHVAKVSGFVSAPRERRTNRDSQYFFVNRRFVRDKTITGGLLEGYRSILPHGVYPVAFLFVELPVEEIDVNVHPAKTEIRFRRIEAVKDVIAEAVRAALSNAGISAENRTAAVDAHSEGSEILLSKEPPADSERPPAEDPIDQSQYLFSPAVVQVENEFVRAAATRSEDLSSGLDAETFTSIDSPSKASPPDAVLDVDTRASVADYAVLPPVNSAAKIARSIDIDAISSRKISLIGQLHESFIIAVDEEGLLLIDQHVAHERILFDKYRQSETDRAIESQNLLLPETIDLTPAQSQTFELIVDHLEHLGFGLMKLSGRTVAIKSIPTDLNAGDARNLFAEILDSIEPGKCGNGKAILRDHIAASLACRAAVKINMKLTPEKMNWLIDRLLLTSSPTTCPHGRPVVLRLSMKDIERGFHRT